MTLPLPTMLAGDLGTAVTPLPLQVIHIGSTSSSGHATTMTIAQPGGVTSGDIGILTFVSASGATVTFPPDGSWTTAGTQVAWKLYGDNEPSVVIPITGSNIDRSAVLSVYRNVHQSAPLDTTPASVTRSGSTLNGATLVAVHDRTLLVSTCRVSTGSGTPTLSSSNQTLAGEAHRTSRATGIAFSNGPAAASTSIAPQWVSTSAAFTNGATLVTFLLRPADT